MNVANLERCRELYELSGWENNAGTRPDDRLKLWQQSYSTWEMGQGNPDYEATPLEKRRGIDIGDWRVVEDNRYMIVTASITHNPSHWYDSEVQKLIEASIPAYDLGYLMRKLPPYYVIWGGGWDYWHYGLIHGPRRLQDLNQTAADAPEDAATKLAIELFKQGVLKRDAA